MKFLTLLLLFWMPAAAAPDEKKFRLENIQLAQSEDGTPEPADFKFAPGDVIFFSCRAAGYGRVGDEYKEDREMSLTYKIEVRDHNNILILPAEDGRVAKQLAPEDKDWRPVIRHTIALPPLADSGVYTISVWVRDEVGRNDASISAHFEVQGASVEASDKLAVRNFRFLRAEEDKEPLAVAAYRAGDTVWARFDMTGYKIGDKNRFEIEYGVKVLRPSGDVTYEQPKAAAYSNESFYPQRYTPGVLSLSVPPDMAKGTYTVVLTVHDILGSQFCETRYKFSIE